MNRSEQTHLKVVARTHPGMTGKNNEDRSLVTAFRLGTNNPIPVLLAVLCDGIGGHHAGEVASEMAVNGITKIVAESEGKHPVALLQNAIESASNQIYQEAQSDIEHRGMGSTTACALMIGSNLYTATVGDSRIYLLRGSGIQQITTDHTWIQEALEKGLITPDQVAGHPNAHIIRRYMGAPTPPKVDFRMRLQNGESDDQAAANQGTVLQPGDMLLLCSDGLTDLVNAEEIQQYLRGKPLDEAVDGLVDLANQRGGHDNITIVAMIVTSKIKPIASSDLNRRHILALGCVGVLLAAALVFLGWLILTSVLPVPSRPPIPSPTIPSVFLNTPVPLPTKQPTILDSAKPTANPGNQESSSQATGTPIPAATQNKTSTPWPTNTPRQ